ncbi:MAG: LPS-assembly protein LptD [Lentisphaeraceae bacterium]|nr:LPS-assembly protein LptD [Lentisphaeraceae bacterium]
MRFYILCLSLFIFSAQAFSYEFSSSKYKIKADIGRQFLDENKVELEGNVSVAYKDAVIYCDRLVYSTKNKDFDASGHVRIVDQQMDFRTHEIKGNLDTKLIQTLHHHATIGPWFLIGEEAQSFPDRSIESKHLEFTTCNIHGSPHWGISSSKIRFMENGDYALWNPVFKVGKVPVFWLPYMVSGIDTNDGMFKITPGYDSDWGAFALVSTEFKLSPEITTKFMLDYRTKKGLGFGNETHINTKNSSTEIALYGTGDKDPEEDSDGYNGRFSSKENRYRYFVSHRSSYFDDKLNFTGKFEKLSDYDFYDEFFTDHYQRRIQTNSYADLTWAEGDYALSLHAKARVNKFNSVVERLPELRYDLERYQVTDNLFYTTNNSVANLKARWREFDEPFAGTPNSDYDSTRIDSLHMFHYTASVDNWLTIVPRAGIRVTHYTDSSESKISSEDLSNLTIANDPERYTPTTINNYDELGGSMTRVLGEVGLEASFKIYSGKTDYKSDYWEIDGLRHIIQPYMNWNWIPFSTEDRDQIYFFDETDRITEQNFVRTGVEQRIQTRRNGKIHNLLTVETYTDFHLQSEEDSTGLGDFGTSITWKPFDNFSLNVATLIDLNELAPNVFKSSFSYKVTDKATVSLSYFNRNEYTSRDLYSNGSSLNSSEVSSTFRNNYTKSSSINASFSYLINAKTLFSSRVSYSLLDDKITRANIELQRKLHCWTMSLLYEIDYDQQSRIMVNFYLNAYPDASIGSGN